MPETVANSPVIRLADRRSPSGARPDSVVPLEAKTSPASHHAGPADDLVGEALADVHRLDTAYVRALDRAMRQNGCDEIATAFDDADRLQRRLLTALRRLRRVSEDRLQRTADPAGPPVPPDAAA
jgi:hypothetical protein